MAPDGKAQPKKRPSIGDTIRERVEAERKRRESEAGTAEEEPRSRLDDLRDAVKKRIEEGSGEPQGRTSRVDEFREAVKKQLAERGVEPQGEATTRRLESRKVASQIGADGLRELKKHGFVLQGHEAGAPDVESSRHFVIPDGPIDFSERIGLLKPILPGNNAGGRVKIETYRFRYVVLIKITNQRTGKVTWIVRRRGSLFGSVLAVISRDAKGLNNQLNGIKGGGPWKTFLQLDKLADLHVAAGDAPTEDNVPVETQVQLAQILKRFEQVRSNPEYDKITNLPEFQSTYENLQALTGSFGASAKPTEPPASTPKDGRLNLNKGFKVEAKKGLKFDAKAGLKFDARKELNFEELNFEESKAGSKRNKENAKSKSASGDR